MKNRDIVIAGYAETRIDFKTGRSACVKLAWDKLRDDNSYPAFEPV